MEIAIQVVWWIGLIGALIATLVILKEVALVIGALGDIHRLAAVTREAARGLARNAAAAPRLAELDGPAVRMREAAGALNAAIRSLEQKLGVLAGSPAPRRGGAGGVGG